MLTDLRDQILGSGGALSLDVSEAQGELLARYLAELKKWNKTYNLTAIRDQGEMVALHVADSLAVAPHLPLKPATRLLDVGSGAGLPGIPLAIAKPEIQVTVLDSNTKKAAFLQQAKAELRLPNVEVIAARVEEWKSAQSFHIIISRAYSEIAIFIAQARHLLAPGGLFAAMKGQYPKDEIAALPAGFAVKEAIRLNVPGVDAERHLILVGAA
ncbi:MAG TPA: 16S rRNA (guanine(527)-N(7))-methyltransferase RsmG [Burkholderiales bacterium]|nr:16S rRNA (guanine(527)-N(7))-methyltransferase RsmG [Burkholderiales bacterium]